MFKKIINYYSLVIAGLLFVVGSYAQVSPDADYNSLGDIANISSGSNVCPSVATSSSTSTFKVLANTSDAGAPATFEFEWVVYGGTIINYSGTSSLGVNNQFVTDTTFSQVRLQGVYNDSSIIVVQWDVFDISQTWVAVRQYSEWGCSDERWSVFTQQVFNEPPALTLPASPDILLGYNQRLGYELPVSFDDFDDPDDCPAELTLTFSIAHPSGAITTGTYDAGNDPASRTVDLEVGDNIVTWTASDGHKQTSVQYTITVDNVAAINHIAWLNPTCDGSSNGILYVHDVSVSPLASVSYRISTNGGTTWSAPQASGTFGTLAAGTYSVDMQVEYDNASGWGSASTYSETTGAYSITLQTMAANVVVNLPTQGSDIDDPLDDDLGLTVSFTNCVDSEDGSIELDPLSPLNSSLSFNGTTHQMPINHFYNQQLGVISVAAWIKTSSNTGGPIISFDPDHYFQLRVTAGSGNCFAWFQTPDGTVTSTQPVNDGQWHLVVGVYNGTSITVYVDGYPTNGTTLGTGNIGSTEITRFGYIGRRSDAATFGTTTSGNFYNGQIADVAIYESFLDSSAVDGLLRNGLSGTYRWLLNHNPTSLSADVQYSDLMNMGANAYAWARFMDATGYPAHQPTDAPILKSWDLAGSLSGLSLFDLDLGTYILSVNDVLGCGSMNQDYEIRSGDESIPYFLSNSALFANASMSATAGNNYARLAVDGMLTGTGYAATPALNPNEWWMVDLAATRTVHRVKILFNTARSNFRVALSQDGVNLNYILDEYTGGNIANYELTVNGTAGRNGRFLHIIDIEGTPQSLELIEVEVWTNQVPGARNFYLGANQCTYPVNSAVDASIDPIPWDVCGGATAYYMDGAVQETSIYGLVLDLNTPQTITWYIADNNPTPITDQLDITYNLIDTIPPSFVNPITNDVTVLTWCDVNEGDGFSIEIPDYSENYVCEGNAIIQTIELFRGSTSIQALTYPDLDPEGTGRLSVDASLLPQGNHNLIWVITDVSGNTARDTLRVYVQTQPRVVNATKVNATCNGYNDGQVIVWNIVKDATETDVEYILSPDGGVTPTSSYFIDMVPAGSYDLTISVNGCESAPYLGGINIGNPAPITITPTLYPPACFGNNDGSIELSTTGGDNFSVLHFPGSGLSTDYTELNQMTTEGTVECWIYLDTLTTDGINSNAAFISKGGSDVDDFVLQMEGGNLTFKVYSDISNFGAAIIPLDWGLYEAKKWYHVTGTWGNGQVGLYLHEAGAEIAYIPDNFTGPAKATGTVRLGSQFSSAAGNTNLFGFIRNARLWKRALASDEIYMNLRLNSPIDPDFDCVANFPLISTLINYNGAALNPNPACTWQDKAYWWTAYRYDVNWNYILDALSLGDYTVEVFDVFGCWDTETIHLPLLDITPPTFYFTSADGSTEEPYNDMHRNADAGSCEYTPSTVTDLDPEITDDDDCGIVDDYWYDINGDMIPDGQSLSGVTLSGTTTVTWYATDGQNIADTTVVYVIDDVEDPYFDASNRTVDLYVDQFNCTYTITSIAYDLDASDYCGIDYIENNFTNTNTLNGATFGVGSRSIRWIAYDLSGNSDTVYQTVTVHDDIPPFNNCGSYDAYLGNDGYALLNAEDLYGLLSNADNCALQSVSIAVNVALNKASYQTDDALYLAGSPCEDDVAAYASNANDGILETDFDNCSVSSTNSTSNPWWYVDLGDTYDIKRIMVYNATGGDVTATNLTNFTIEISANSSFSPAHTITYNNAQQAFYQFDIDVSAPQSGQYVRITSFSGDKLQMAEFEVYGVLLGAATENVALSKDALQYSTYMNDNGTDHPCVLNTSARRATDGNTNGNFYTDCSVTHTSSRAPYSEYDYEYWQVDLGGLYRIDQVDVYDRTDINNRLFDFYVILADNYMDYPSYSDFTAGRTGTSGQGNLNTRNQDLGDDFWSSFPNLKTYYSYGPDVPNPGTITGINGGDFVSIPINGDVARYVRIWMDHSNHYQNLAEVMVYGVRVDIPETSVSCDHVRAGSVTAIVTATDLSGNIFQCDAGINVIDDIPPTPSANNMSVSLDVNGQAILRAIDVDNGSYDNCGIDSFLVEGVEEFILDCDSLDQELTLTFTVVDFYGNRANTDFLVTVIDEEGPNLACPTSGTVVDVYLNNYGELTLDRDYILDYVIPGSSDNCGGEAGIITIASDYDFFNCDSLFIDKGTYNITITAGDIYANESTCAVEIAVRDTIRPRVRARNATITVGALDQPFDLTLVDNASYDNCDIEDFWSVPATYGTCQSQTVEVVLWAIDRSGNISSDTADIVFTPSFKILSFGLDECSSISGGTEWAASIEGNLGDLHFNWVSDDNHAHFDGATTSILERPGYTTVGGNHDCWVTLTVTDSIITATDTIVCIATKQQKMSFKPGNSNQHFNNITTEYEEACYGETVKYYVPGIDINDPDIEVIWTIESPDETGNIYGGEIIGDDDSDTVTVRWNSSASYPGLRTFQGTVLASVFITVPNPPPANKTKTCRDGYFFNVSVYDNPDPGLQIFGGGTLPITVCPGDTLTYEVIYLDDEFTWDWMPITQGEVIEGGQSNNPTMTVVWGSALGAVDSVKVIAYNFIGCSDSVVSLPITITDTWPPVFTSVPADFNITLPTNPGQCVAWLTNLPIPEAQDECDGNVCAEPSCYNLTYSINGPGINISNKAGNLFNTENLPVGTHTVTWVATDIGGNTTNPSNNFIYSIEVEDQQRPSFPYSLADTTLYAGDAECYCKFDEPTGNPPSFYRRQITASDNCSGSIEYARAIYYPSSYDTVGWRSNFATEDWSAAPGVGIDAILFPKDTSTVFYYARDQYGNVRALKSFRIIVRDEKSPDITEAGDLAYFSNITENSDASSCGQFIDVSKPSLAVIEWAYDNCTDSEDLVVSGVRSDGVAFDANNATNVWFPIGETTIIWTITDESGNTKTRSQVIIVNDIHAPEYTGNLQPAQLNYTWCEKGNIRLPIPTLFDNCNNFDSLRVNVNATGSKSVSGVSLSASTATIEEGTNFLLAAYISPSDASNQLVSWSSNDYGVASVNNGLVTGNAPGTAIITVTSSDGGYTATCEVTVTATSMGPNLISNGDFNNGTNDWDILNSNGSSLSISSGEMRINISNSGGETWQPQMVQDGFSITNGVTYYVSFDARATNSRNFQHTVNTGPNDYTSFLDETVSLTTTMQNFTYTFTAGLNDANARFDFNVGQNNSDIFIDNVELRVANASSIVSVTGVNLTPASTSVGVGNTKLLAAAVAPAAATNQSVIWSSKNTAVATVSASGLVTGVSQGSATITVTTADGNFTDDCVVTVTAGGSVFFTQLFTNFPLVATQTDVLPITAEGTYSVQWTVWDRTLSALSTPYNLIIQRQPLITGVDPVNTSCPGATDGSITVTAYEAEPGATIEYSIQAVGSGYQAGNEFENLGAGNYNYLHIRANGCASPYRLVSLSQLPAYQISGTVTHNWCAEATDGVISVQVSGGLFENNTNAGGTFEWWIGDYPGNPISNISGVATSSNTAGEASASNLPSGQYHLVYTDDNGECTASANFTVVSADNESPEAQGFSSSVLVVETDPDVCVHDVTAAEATVPAWGAVYTNTNLVPATQDDLGCDYDTYYQITNANGTSGWIATLQNYELTKGGNNVTIQFTQNSFTYNDGYVYNIRVDDKQVPTLAVQAISGELDANGELLITAAALDNGSDDNCPGTLTYQVRKLETDPWANQVLFDCNDVGDAASVFFKVTDISGNADSTSITGFTITDNIPPTIDISIPFEYSYCATIRATPSYITKIGDFELNVDDYSDNCNITSVEYMVEHETEGTTQDWTIGNAGYLGNAAYFEDGTDMEFYEGKNYIYFRVSDSNTTPNVSLPVRCFIVTVYPQPEPSEINE